MLNIPEPLNSRYVQAINKINSSTFIRVLAHYDADGVTSAAIVSKILISAEKNFQVTFIKDLSVKNIERNLKNENCTFLLLDLGASLITLLEKYQNVIVLDHHPLEKDSEIIININPVLIKMDGGKDACGATLSFILAQYYDKSLFSLYPIYLAGMIADKQDLDEYSGLNKILIDEIEKINPSKFEFRFEGITIKDMLMNATEPYLADISGNKDNIEKLLKSLGIGEEDTFESLSEDKKINLGSIITLKLIEQGANTDTIKNIFAKKFDVWNSNDRTISSIVNACARSEKQALAVSYLLGDLNNVDEVNKIWNEYRNRLINELRRIEKDCKKLNFIQYFYSYEESMCGELSGIAMLYFLDQNLATICMHSEDSEIHVSARATKLLIDRGIDLGLSMSNAAKEVGGFGGGHKIAAGATIPKGKENEFLKLLDENLKI
ncbi:MAG: DHH family phosphoesterase [Thermoplasmata archaeon]